MGEIRTCDLGTGDAYTHFTHTAASGTYGCAMLDSLTPEQQAWFCQTVSALIDRAARDASEKAVRGFQRHLRDLLGFSE